MNQNIKMFIIGFVSALVAIGLVVGGFFLVVHLKDKARDKEYEDIKQEETIDGITYYVDYRGNQNLKCDAFNDIMYFNYRYFIQSDGSLYELSDKEYSDTKQNCRLISDIKVKTYSDSTIISTDNKIYYYEQDGFREIDYLDILETVKDKDDIVSIDDYYENANHYAIYIKKDGKLYKSKVNNDYNTGNKYVLSNEELYLSFDNEKIKKFSISMGGLNEGNDYVITDKAIYVKTATNRECFKYADVKCNYEFSKNSYLTKYLNDLVNFSIMDGGEFPSYYVTTKTNTYQIVTKDSNT